MTDLAISVLPDISSFRPTNHNRNEPMIPHSIISQVLVSRAGSIRWPAAPSPAPIITTYSRKIIIAARPSQPFPSSIRGEACFEGGVDILLQSGRERGHVEATLAVKVPHKLGRKLGAVLSATVKRHEVEADVVLLLDGTGKPDLVLPAAVDDQGLLDDEVIVALVLDRSFADGERLGVLAEDGLEVIEDGIEVGGFGSGA